MLLKDVITLSLASVMALALVLDFALAIITTIALIFLLVPAHDTHSGVVVTKSTMGSLELQLRRQVVHKKTATSLCCP